MPPINPERFYHTEEMEGQMPDLALEYADTLRGKNTHPHMLDAMVEVIQDMACDLWNHPDDAKMEWEGDVALCLLHKMYLECGGRPGAIYDA